MKTRKEFIGFAILIMALFFFGSQAMAGDKKLKLKFPAYFGKQSSGWDAMYEQPARLIEKALNGRAKVTVFPSNSLTNPKEAYRALQTEICDLTWVWGPAIPGAFPLTDLFSLPGFSPNQATSNYVVNELFAQFPEFKKQYDPKVKHIASQVHMRTDLHSTEPIRSLADLKGKLIACQDKATAEALALLGVSVTQMQQPDMYHALERGVVKGVVVAWGTIAALRLHEVTKYHTLLGIGTATSHWLWSKKTWDKLSPQEQAVIEAYAATFQNYVAKGNVDMARKVRSQDVIPANGHEIITWSDEDMNKMRDMFRPIWDKWAEDMEGKGLPGKAILKEAEALITAYKQG